MDDLVVAVQSTDEILRAGLTAVLGCHPLIRVDQIHPGTDALVVIEDAINDASIATIRRTRCIDGRIAKAPCLIVTDDFPSAALMPAIEAGVVAVVPRSSSVERIAGVVIDISNGAAHLSPQLQKTLIAHVERIRADILEPNNLTVAGLTLRERDVLRLVAQGLDTADIGSQMSYSERTVKNILHGLMTRLNLQNRAHAVAYAIRVGAF